MEVHFVFSRQIPVSKIIKAAPCSEIAGSSPIIGKCVLYKTNLFRVVVYDYEL